MGRSRPTASTHCVAVVIRPTKGKGGELVLCLSRVCQCPEAPRCGLHNLCELAIAAMNRTGQQDNQDCAVRRQPDCRDSNSRAGAPVGSVRFVALGLPGLVQHNRQTTKKKNRRPSLKQLAATANRVLNDAVVAQSELEQSRNGSASKEHFQFLAQARAAEEHSMRLAFLATIGVLLGGCGGTAEPSDSTKGACGAGASSSSSAHARGGSAGSAAGGSAGTGNAGEAENAPNSAGRAGSSGSGPDDAQVPSATCAPGAPCGGLNTCEEDCFGNRCCDLSCWCGSSDTLECCLRCDSAASDAGATEGGTPVCSPGAPCGGLNTCDDGCYGQRCCNLSCWCGSSGTLECSSHCD
jgi:hypothetical protein